MRIIGASRAWSSWQTLTCDNREEKTHEKNIRCRCGDDRQQYVFNITRAAVSTCDKNHHRVHEQRELQRYRYIAAKTALIPPVMSLSRARSWPLDATGREGCAAAFVDGSSLKEKSRPTEISDNGGKNDTATVQPVGSPPQVQARRLLCRHYYPEGGWGWVITVVGTLMHLLGPGLQFSVPATVALPAKIKFYHSPLHTAGELKFPSNFANMRLTRRFST